MSNKGSVRFFRKDQTGQTIVEVLIAATAMVIVIVAIISGMTLSLRNSTFSNSQALATKRTQEAIEVLRRFQVELGWESFYSIISSQGSRTNFTYCMASVPETVSELRTLPTSSCGAGTVIPDTPFTREVHVVVNSSQEIEFEAVVEWMEADKTLTSRSTQVFRQWQ